MKRKYRFEEVFHVGGSCGYEDVFDPCVFGLLEIYPHPTQQNMICDECADVKLEFLKHELLEKLSIQDLKEIARKGLRYIDIEIEKKYEQWFKKYYNVFDQVLRSRAITALLMRAKKYYIRTHKVEVKRCNCTLPELKFENAKAEVNFIGTIGVPDPDEWTIKTEKVYLQIPDNWKKIVSTNGHELYYHPVKLLHFIEIDPTSEKSNGDVVIVLYEVK